MVTAAGLYVTLGGCIRDIIRIRWAKELRLLVLSLQNLYETEPSMERPPKKDVASDAQNAPAPGGPGTSQTRCFQLFRKNEIHPGSASRKISKSNVGPKVRKLHLAHKKEHMFVDRCFTTLRVASAAKQIQVWSPFLSHRLFRIWDKPSCSA